MGVIDEKYQALGGATGWLGAPTIPESGTPDGKGRFRHYQNGSIYWNPATGAHEVHGSIRRRWQELGWETGFLGYPLTDEMTTPDGAGRYSHFQGGSIYWSPATGAYEVRNAGALRSHRIGLWGFADLHAHPASHLAFGGDAADVAFGGRPEGLMGIFWGKPGMRLEDSNATIADDLRSCVPDKHHDSPRRDGYDEDGVRHGTRTTVIAMANQLTNLPHQASGWPDFTGWPHALSVMHQQMHISWIHRAWQGGLRLLIASVTDSQTLSMFWTRSHGAPRPQPNPNYDYESAKFQLAFIRQFVAANSSWMQVVLTPAEARSAIAANKLAIILSVEMDTLTTEQIADLYRNHSVRHVTPIHLLNNKFGGVAVYSDMFNTANGYVNGDFFRVEHDSTLEFGLGRPERLIYISGDPFGGGDLFKYGAVEPHKIDEATYRNLGYPAPGHKNVRGLQKAEMQKLLRLGIMIDLAHMSEKSTEETLQLAEQSGMPVMNSHTGCRHEEHGHSERDLKFSHAARIGKLGGMIGLGTGGDSSSDPVAHWYALYREVLATMKGRGVALGTDMNGFAPQMTSTEQAVSYPIDVAVRFAGRGSQRGQPLGRLQVGNKLYDFTLDGLAHYGLLPDFLQAVSKHTSLEPIFRTAEETIQMWERVELATRKVNNPTPSRLVALRAASGHYLYPEGSEKERLLALANEITPSEIFEMIELGNNKVAFRASNGKLIQAINGGGGALRVAQAAIGAWETFERIDLGHGVIALKASNGQYLCAESGGGQEVVANRSQIGDWEKFVVISNPLEKESVQPIPSGVMAIDQADLFSDNGTLPGYSLFVYGTDRAIWEGIASKPSSGLLYPADSSENFEVLWQPLGGLAAKAKPTVLGDAKRRELLVLGLDGAIWQRSYDIKTGWSNWLSLGGKFQSSPAACSWSSDRFDVFARGSDNAIWHRWRGPNWSSWQSLGGSAISAPVAVSRGRNLIDLFVLGPDQAIWHKQFANGAWIDWKKISDSSLSFISQPAVVSCLPGRLDLFARDLTAMWHRSLTGKSAVWSKWANLGGDQLGISDFSTLDFVKQGIGLERIAPIALSRAKETIELLARDKDGNLWQRSYGPAVVGTTKKVWTNWRKEGNITPHVPSAIAIEGTLKHVAVGYDGATWGVNAEDLIFRWDGRNWHLIPGKLKQISVGNTTEIWGVNANDEIFRWKGDNWELIPGRLKYVSVGGDGTVWGVNAADEIFRRNSNGWTVVPGRLKQISVGNVSDIWGVNNKDEIFMWNGTAWRLIPGSFKYISVGFDGTVWGINTSGGVYRMNGNEWVNTGGNLLQISVGSIRHIWAINASNKIIQVKLNS